MAKHGTASAHASGTFVEFSAAVLRNLPRDLEPDVMDGWRNNGESLARILREALAPPQTEMPFEPKPVAQAQIPAAPEDILVRWRRNYVKIGINPNLEGVVIPEGKPGFDRVIVVAEGITLNRIYDGLAELFPCWRSHDDLDAVVTENERTPVKAYAIRVKNRAEADEELKNLSANDVKKRRIATETVLERMLHELDYFLETGKHLDEKNVTLCAGSRSSDGGVPYADWGDGEFRVDADWYDPSDSGGDLRARAVVSV